MRLWKYNKDSPMADKVRNLNTAQQSVQKLKPVEKNRTKKNACIYLFIYNKLNRK